MKWFKRLMCLSMSAAVIFSLAACGGEELTEGESPSISSEKYGGMYAAGQKLRRSGEDGEELAAIYNGQEIPMSAVKYNKEMNALRGGEAASGCQSDIDSLNQIIENLMLVEEAEKQGLAATQEEIEEMVEMTQRAYEIPEGKEMMDDYCEGAGISADEYFDMVREQAPGLIARQKLKDAVGKKYCEENGIEFTKVNPPAEMIEAENAYISELFEANRDKIEYFIDK